MLRVGLTGDLGAGKSTVAKMLAERGAVVFSSDEMARVMMQPGEPVYAAIVAAFGGEVVAADGTLDRRMLATLAFEPAQPREAELSAIVHPPVIAAQAAAMAELATRDPGAIVVVESALLFTSGDWRERFDRVVLVTAPEAVKVARFVERVAAGRVLPFDERAALEADARRRLAMQQTEDYASECLVIRNDGDREHLAQQIDAVWPQLLGDLYR
jgi:dephospho-CoA kinase